MFLNKYSLRISSPLKQNYTKFCSSSKYKRKANISHGNFLWNKTYRWLSTQESPNEVRAVIATKRFSMSNQIYRVCIFIYILKFHFNLESMQWSWGKNVRHLRGSVAFRVPNLLTGEVNLTTSLNFRTNFWFKYSGTISKHKHLFA